MACFSDSHKDSTWASSSPGLRHKRSGSQSCPHSPWAAAWFTPWDLHSASRCLTIAQPTFGFSYQMATIQMYVAFHICLNSHSIFQDLCKVAKAGISPLKCTSNKVNRFLSVWLIASTIGLTHLSNTEIKHLHPFRLVVFIPRPPRFPEMVSLIPFLCTSFSLGLACPSGPLPPASSPQGYPVPDLQAKPPTGLSFCIGTAPWTPLTTRAIVLSA